MSDTTPMLRQALEYAKRGWAVFPVWGCRSNGACRCYKRKACPNIGKHPWTDHGFHDATTDAKRIRARKWKNKWPTANIGIATGATSGLVVLDIDSLKGGEQAMAALIAKLGRLPKTLKVRTGHGWHLYFEHPGGFVKTSRDAIGIGLDIRADGGYVVAPPSLHRSGNHYEWTPGRGFADGTLEKLPRRWLEELGRMGCYTDSTDRTDRAGPHRQRKTTQDDSDQRGHPTTDRPGRAPGHDLVERSGQPGSATPPTWSRLSANILEMPAKEFIKWAIARTIPYGPSQRHHQVFLFAKTLRGHPEISQWEPALLMKAAEAWYKAAVRNLGEGQIKASCDENTEDFLEGWENVHTPGVGIVEHAFAAAVREEPPKAADDFSDERTKRLLTACREMQRLVGDGQPWYLSTRHVCRLMPEFERPMSVYRILCLFERRGILEVVEPGSPAGRKATSYRYLLPVDG